MPKPTSTFIKTRKIEKTPHKSPPPVNSLKLIIKFKNSRSYAILPISKCSESRKRKEPAEKKINMGMNLYDQTWFNIKKNTRNKKTKILDPPPPAAAAYMGNSKQSPDPEDIRVTKQLKSFSVYSHQEEQEETFMGVSTKLTLLTFAH